MRHIAGRRAEEKKLMSDMEALDSIESQEVGFGGGAAL